MHISTSIRNREDKKKPAKKAVQCYSNYRCDYFPCHETDSREFNCLFCYCPMYFLHVCLGRPRYLLHGGLIIKDCSGCDYPHRPENYTKIVDHLITAISS
ncbi:MAG: cysteine-rich small domain-containing protein [Alphaproteobacteria bacterium]|uniref:Cysteine-rich small domain-containing protein n=1 Tax=Candidatus Nitrobium versatile TaxID=2884831 RepID=A0A953JE80_9BACT|nr:cysteine-rich small domain-containing protein [Candidatus Nitrobium versatile]